MRLTSILATRSMNAQDRSSMFRRQLGLESLEVRRVLSLPAPGAFEGELEMFDGGYEREGIQFDVAVDGGLAQKFPLLESNVETATNLLRGLLGGYGSIDVQVRAGDLSKLDPVYASALAWTSGPESWFPTADSGVWQAGTIYEALNGVDLNGASPDIVLEFNPKLLATDVWFDAGGSSNPTIPQNKEDCVSIVVHELLHGLGFSGFRTTTDGANWGKFTLGKKSTYDALTDFGIGGLFGEGTSQEVVYFSGQHAVAQYGDLVPLDSVPHGFANFYHVGNSYGDGKYLYGDLMFATGGTLGKRVVPSNLDVAILRDLGWKEPAWVPKEIEFDWSQFYVLPPIFPEPPIGPDFLGLDPGLAEVDGLADLTDPLAGPSQQEPLIQLDSTTLQPFEATDRLYEQYGVAEPFVIQPATSLSNERFGELVDLALTGLMETAIR